MNRPWYYELLGRLVYVDWIHRRIWVCAYPGHYEPVPERVTRIAKWLLEVTSNTPGIARYRTHGPVRPLGVDPRRNGGGR